jgi:hypothetical protein
MNEKCKFNKGQLVYFTLQGINDGELMKASIPKKYFELNVAYIVDDIGLYGDGWHILVKDSSQFIHERYFLNAKPEVKEPTERIKYEIIVIDGKEYFLIPKNEKQHLMRNLKEILDDVKEQAIKDNCQSWNVVCLLAMEQAINEKVNEIGENKQQQFIDRKVIFNFADKLESELF